MADPRKDFKGRSFLKEIDFTKDEFVTLIDFAAELKAAKKAGQPHRYCEGKNIALLFEKSSTRTRCAFTVASIDLGMHPEYLGAGDIQLGKKETTEDTAKVLGRMFDAIEFRGFSQDDVEALAKFSGVPVYNGLTDKWHPTQMLADFLTIKECLGKLDGATLTFMGDTRSNMAHSLLVAGLKVGLNVHLCGPKELHPAADIVELAEASAAEGGGKFLITDDVAEAVPGSDVIYTDVWVSMGEEDKFAERIALLTPYRVTKDVMDATGKPDAIFLHCLPAFHDTNTVYGRQIKEQFDIDCMEVTDEVFRSPAAHVFEEAENRMHTIKAVIAATLGEF
ncbi:MAG: ornithine carbamoyltransferase [Coriobacteriia bacterium]|nr:ornithine carbamoyltransferase [Coriobacteriia bacterium]